MMKARNDNCIPVNFYYRPNCVIWCCLDMLKLWSGCFKQAPMRRVLAQLVPDRFELVKPLIEGEPLYNPAFDLGSFLLGGLFILLFHMFCLLLMVKPPPAQHGRWYGRGCLCG